MDIRRNLKDNLILIFLQQFFAYPTKTLMNLKLYLTCFFHFNLYFFQSNLHLKLLLQRCLILLNLHLCYFTYCSHQLNLSCFFHFFTNFLEKNMKLCFNFHSLHLEQFDFLHLIFKIRSFLLFQRNSVDRKKLFILKQLMVLYLF